MEQTLNKLVVLLGLIGKQKTLILMIILFLKTHPLILKIMRKNMMMKLKELNNRI
jgi:hypothetical protein